MQRVRDLVELPRPHRPPTVAHRSASRHRSGRDRRHLMTQPELNGVIEHLIVHPRDGDEARYALITAILGAMLILPSGTDVSSDPAGLRPVVIDHEGTPHVVVFNSVEAARTMRE